MKAILLSLLLAATVAVADPTVISFDSPTFCYNYCSGYTTNSPDHSVGYVNDTAYQPGVQKITLSLDGVTYSGPGVELSGAISGYAVVDTVVSAANGAQLQAHLVVLLKNTVVNSGRAHYTIQRHFVQSGTLTL